MSTVDQKSETIPADTGLLAPNPNTRFATLFDEKNPFLPERGGELQQVQVAYETYGNLAETGDNAILICHALTGDAHVGNNPQQGDLPGWWAEIIGPGKSLDTDKYFVVCANFLGSCYGTTGPVSINPKTGKRYGVDFPEVTVRDMVIVQHELLQQLGVREIATVIGGSLGGMQVLEWAVMYPEMVRRIIPIATTARHSAWSIALNETARLAIMNDPDWQNGNYDKQPLRGLSLARMIAMISYRSQPSFQERFGREEVDLVKLNGSARILNDQPPRFQVESYLRYQGIKLVKRFDANTYLTITRAMDSHDLSRNREPLTVVLSNISAKTLCIGISSDVLYPPHEQREISENIPNAEYREIISEHGHDAFLIEFDQLNKMVSEFLVS